MSIVNPGFGGRRRSSRPDLPPGQYLTEDFPVLSAGPPPRIPLDRWGVTGTHEGGGRQTWTGPEFLALPAEDVTVDLHCVTKWSKLGTRWRGVSLDTLLVDVETSADFVLAPSYACLPPNRPLAALVDGQAWVAHRYDDDDLPSEHGGPARLLVPHLYLWKSAKW